MDKIQNYDYFGSSVPTFWTNDGYIWHGGTVPNFTRLRDAKNAFQENRVNEIAA